MKGLTVIVLAVCVASAVSIHIEYAESIAPGWGLVDDGDGNLHLAALHEIDGAPEPAFNANSDVIFRLFTRRNPNNGQVITLNNAGSLHNSQFVNSHPTRFIIHGWNNNGGSQVNNAIRSAYINRGEFNVITVDWGAGAQTSNYLAARNRVPDVGGVVAQFINWANSAGGMNSNTISVIGHSLGGHAAGICGKRANNRIHTIIGLDPAFPLFSMDQPGARIAATDANYVEVIHTNAGVLGFDQPIGQASFYPNMGRLQNGCGNDVGGMCSHSRAHEFFAESIAANSAGFWARRCRNYNDILNGNCVANGGNARMAGEPSSSGINGIFWLQTNAGPPFARGNVL